MKQNMVYNLLVLYDGCLKAYEPTADAVGFLFSKLIFYLPNIEK